MPVEMETGTVPADDGRGFHNDEDVFPARPETPERRPEQTVQEIQSWPRTLAFENGDLLAKSEDFDGGVASTAEENADHRKDGENEFRHELTLVT